MQMNMMDMMKEAKRLSMLPAAQLCGDPPPSNQDQIQTRSNLQQRTYSMSVLESPQRGVSQPFYSPTAAALAAGDGATSVRAQDDSSIGCSTGRFARSNSTMGGWGRGGSYRGVQSRYNVGVQREVVDLDGRYVTVDRLLLSTVTSLQSPVKAASRGGGSAVTAAGAGGDGGPGQQSEVFPVRWVLNESIDRCMICMQLFTTLRRRHHCRSCGQLVCGPCSQTKVIIAEFSLSQRQRVCRKCNRGFNNIIHLTAPTPAPPFAIVQHQYTGRRIIDNNNNNSSTEKLFRSVNSSGDLVNTGMFSMMGSASCDDFDANSPLVMCDIEDHMGIRVVLEAVAPYCVLRICSSKGSGATAGAGAGAGAAGRAAGAGEPAVASVAYHRALREDESAVFNICTHRSVPFNPRLDELIARTEAGDSNALSESVSNMKQPVIYFVVQQQDAHSSASHVPSGSNASRRTEQQHQHLAIFDVVVSPTVVERLQDHQQLREILVSQLLCFWNLLMRTDFAATDVYFQFVAVPGNYFTPWNSTYVAAPSLPRLPPTGVDASSLQAAPQRQWTAHPQHTASAQVFLPRRMKVLEKWGHLLLLPAQYLETVADIFQDASTAVIGPYAPHETEIDDDSGGGDAVAGGAGGERHVKAMSLDMSHSELALSTLMSSSQLNTQYICAAAAPHSLLYPGSRLLKTYADHEKYLQALQSVRQLQRGEAITASVASANGEEVEPRADALAATPSPMLPPLTASERAAQRRTMGALLTQRLGMLPEDAYDSDDDPPAASASSSITGRQVVAAMQRAVIEDSDRSPQRHEQQQQQQQHWDGAVQHDEAMTTQRHRSISTVKSELTEYSLAAAAATGAANAADAERDSKNTRRRSTWRSIVSTAQHSLDSFSAAHRAAPLGGDDSESLKDHRRRSFTSRMSWMSSAGDSKSTTNTKKLPAKERFAQQQRSAHHMIDASMMRIESLRNISGIASQEMKAQSLRDPYVLLGWQIQLCVPLSHDTNSTAAAAAAAAAAGHADRAPVSLASIAPTGQPQRLLTRRSFVDGPEEDFQIRIGVITGVRVLEAAPTTAATASGSKVPRQKRRTLKLFSARKEQMLDTAACDTTTSRGAGSSDGHESHSRRKSTGNTVASSFAAVLAQGNVQLAEFRVSSVAYADTWLKLNRFPHNSADASQQLLMDGVTLPAPRSSLAAAAEDGLNFKLMRRVFNVKVKGRGVGKMHILSKAS